jgi:hypothetical protein
MVKAMLVMIHYRLSSVRSLARFLEQHLELAFACGFDPATMPSYRTLLRRFKTLDKPVLQVAKKLLSKMVALGIVHTKILVIDAAPLRAKGNPPKGEKSIKPSDPEARFGFQKHGQEVYFGYPANGGTSDLYHRTIGYPFGLASHTSQPARGQFLYSFVPPGDRVLTTTSGDCGGCQL